MATAVVLPAHGRNDSMHNKDQAAGAGWTESHNRVEAGSFPLAAGNLPVSPVSKDEVDANQVVSEWLSSFQKVLGSKDFKNLENLFLPEAYWRDQLCLSWNFHTFKNANKMTEFLSAHPQACRLLKLSIDDSSSIRKPTVQAIDFTGEVQGVVSYLTVETDVGRGRGIVRLCKDSRDGNWKAFTLFTTMHELKGHEEPLGPRRPDGVSHGANPLRKNWADRRKEEIDFRDSEPTVMIIGAGQAGLTLAARLKQLGVPTLLIDRNTRVGDNWRKRYHQLVLHDPVWYDHLPYLNFPDFWPKFTPKDKLGDWFESYAKFLELNTWMSTELKSLEYSNDNKRWTITLTRWVDGKLENRTVKPKYVVQATGHSGEKNFPSHIKGIHDFKGDLLCHSSEFPGAKPNTKGKKAIVVGCCNSGHDIAQDFYEKGYDVTIVQRSSTYVMTSEAGLDVLLGGLYEEGGPPIEDADLSFMSVPNHVLKRLHVDATKEIARRDDRLLQGLKKAGFALDNGPDDAGFFMKYFQRGGGYYIDVGASQLIVDGKIKMKQGQEITSVNEHSLSFKDGSELEADEVVFATGYSNMRETCRKIFGSPTADRVKDVWGFDEEGELRTLWRRTGHEGLWFMGGNLGLCRYYSRMLALQIKALDEEIMGYDDL